MNFFDVTLAPPRADHILIAKYIVIVLSLMFVPYISTLFGSTLLSLIYSFRGKNENNPMFSRLSQDIADTLMGGWGMAIVMGMLPIFTLAACFAQMLYGAEVAIVQYMAVTLVAVVVSIVLAMWFKKSFNSREAHFTRHLGLGLLAIGAFHFAFFAFVSSVTVLTFPEKWPLITSAIPLTFDWNMVARLAHFITLTLAITGAAMIFYFFNWMGGKEGVEGEYRDYIRKLGGGLTLAFTVLQTLFFVWYVATLPEMAKSQDIYTLSVVSLAILWGITVMAYFLLANSELKYGTVIFSLVMVFLLIVLVNEHIARESSLSYQNYTLQKLSTELEEKIALDRAQRGGAVASIETGSEIYNAKCIACHRFDVKVVGPPYMSVLPKYKDDLASLKAFVLNPVKKNPEYPAMPNQGLKPHEAESVAMYLLQKYAEMSAEPAQ